MEYFDYIINYMLDIIETFFNNFTIVSGKTTLRVLYFSILYLFISIVSSITNKFSFIDVWSCLLSVILLILINCISVVQRKDIDKFKKLLKGDSNE